MFLVGDERRVLVRSLFPTKRFVILLFRAWCTSALIDDTLHQRGDFLDDLGEFLKEIVRFANVVIELKELPGKLTMALAPAARSRAKDKFPGPFANTNQPAARLANGV